MADESVVFEIQVEKHLLEQLLIQNEHLRYDRYLRLEEHEKHLTNEVAWLKERLQDKQETNREIIEENIRLKAELRNLKIFRQLYEDRNSVSSMESNENKLLRMKLNKLEEEKKVLMENFEKQRIFFETVVNDNYRLRKAEDAVKDLRTKLALIRWNLVHDKQTIRRLREDNQKLDWAKLDAETALADMTKKMRLMEERFKMESLKTVDSKLLKLKLNAVENDKKYLMADFERERKILSNLSKPRVAKIEDNLKALRHWIEKEASARKPHESDEMRALRAKVQTLDEEKVSLLEALELERRVFSKVLKDQSISGILS